MTAIAATAAPDARPHPLASHVTAEIDRLDHLGEVHFSAAHDGTAVIVTREDGAYAVECRRIGYLRHFRWISERQRTEVLDEVTAYVLRRLDAATGTTPTPA